MQTYTDTCARMYNINVILVSRMYFNRMQATDSKYAIFPHEIRAQTPHLS